MTDILSQISQMIDKGGLITGDDVGMRSNDWMGRAPCKAKAVVRPSSTQQLSDIMKLCHAAGQPVVPAGGLTGLVHGAEASCHEILVSFERMAEVESIDPVGRTMTVQAGAQLQKVQEAAETEDLLFTVDLGARGSATIGGKHRHQCGRQSGDTLWHDARACSGPGSCAGRRHDHVINEPSAEKQQRL